MDNFGVNARIAEFDKRNGGGSVMFNGWLLYANGAKRDVEPMGALIDPPGGEYERLTNIRDFHRARLATAVKEFDSFKERLMISVIDGESMEQLKRLQMIVSERNEAVRKATEQLAGTKEEKQRQLSRQMDAEWAKQQADFRNAVKAIRI